MNRGEPERIAGILKRAVDIAASSLGLVLLSPALLAVAVVVKLTSPGPALFRQQRVGIEFRPFAMLKFRTMVADAPCLGGLITVGADPRITRVGRFLRKTKIDELPQLLNVLRGDMSLVGPRPEVDRYVERFRRDYEEILSIRPGITDLASLQYRDEASLLAAARDPEEEYIRRILPEKIRLAKEYVGRRSLQLDLAIVFGTVAQLASDLLPKVCSLWQGSENRRRRHVTRLEGQKTSTKEERSCDTEIPSS